MIKAKKSKLKPLWLSLALVMGLSFLSVFTIKGQQLDQAFNYAIHASKMLGNVLLGFNFGIFRQNFISLAHDLLRRPAIIDHGVKYNQALIGAFNFVSQGEIYNVRDALKFAEILLTDRQKKSLNLCRPLSDLGRDEAINISPDPWQKGIASWYGPGFNGRMAASGEIYNMYQMTAAHKTLPLQSLVRVVKPSSGESIIVRINDRGPYVGNRIIDLSYEAKRSLGLSDLGYVYLEVVKKNSLDVVCN